MSKLFESIDNLFDTNEVILSESRRPVKEALNFKKYGIQRAADQDFRDDGSSFKGYVCNGMPITYSRYNGEVFLSICPDYLGDLNYDEYSKLPSYKDCDKYNGVPEDSVDLEDVADICKRFKAEYDEAVSKLSDVSDDDYKALTDTYLEKAKREYKEALEKIESLGSEKLLGLSNYTIANLRRYLDGLRSGIKNWDWESQKNTSQSVRRRQMTDESKEYESKINWYLSEINEIIDKALSTNESEEPLKEDKESDVNYILKLCNMSIEEDSCEDDCAQDNSCEDDQEKLTESEYTPNARKCIDAANLLGQIDLKDIEDAAKIKAQIEKLFDKLIKLAPKLNKKEQKEMEEATKCEEDSESLKAAKANMEKLRQRHGFVKPKKKSGEGDSVEFVSPEAYKDIEKKANDVKKAFDKSKRNVKESEASNYDNLKQSMGEDFDEFTKYLMINYCLNPERSDEAASLGDKFKLNDDELSKMKSSIDALDPKTIETAKWRFGKQ